MRDDEKGFPQAPPARVPAIERPKGTSQICSSPGREWDEVIAALGGSGATIGGCSAGATALDPLAVVPGVTTGSAEEAA